MAREDMFELPVPVGNKAEEQHQDPVTSFSLNTKLAVASIGFFTDAYDLFVINLVMVILTSLYSITDFQGANIATFALVGAIAGQLFFGFAGDSIGRFTSWIVTMSLIIVGALATAFAPTSSTATVAMWIAIWRLLLGVGIGGEYPLSSVVPSEASASSHSRGRNIALVFAMQGWGNLFAPVFIYVLLQILGSSDRSLEIIWRVALGFGAVPCMVTFYFRYMMFKEAQNHEKQNRKVRLNLQKVKENAKYLVGTAGSWFIFDIVFYANGLFNGLVLAQLFGTSSKEMKHNLSKTALSGIVIALIALPGYYAAVLLIDRIGRKPLQIIGFFMMAVLYFILGFFYQTLHQKVVWFVIIYGLTFFFSNFGPNTTTFVSEFL
jgi:PHS family inorganic phosphate transporter-like MFS transporter